MGSLGKFVLFAVLFTASSMFGQQDSAPPPDNSSQSQPAQPQNQSQPENQPQNQSQPSSPDQTQPAPPQPEPSQTQSQPSTPQTEPAQQQPSTQVPAQQENKPPAEQESKPATKPKAPHHTTHKKSTPKATAKTTSTKTPKSGKTSATKSKQSASTKKPATKGPTIIVDPTGKVVVRNGGATADPVEISPGVTKEQEVRDRENIEQLLATTETNLKSVEGRQLTPAQQSSLDQIRAYVRQAKAASAAGDTTRARTLASKANLLAVELAKK